MSTRARSPFVRFRPSLSSPIRLATTVIVVSLCASTAFARSHPDARTTENLIPSVPSRSAVSLDQDMSAYRLRSAAAAPETTFLGVWSFDSGGSCSDEGWVSVDNTGQTGVYFHVDDFAGLGGGDFGRLVALEGSRSMWCGARAGNDYYFCTYATLPGYGNNWDQTFGTEDCLSVSGDVHVNFIATWDSDPGYDFTCVEFDTCDGDWVPAQLSQLYYGCLTGWGTDRFNVIVGDTLQSGSVRLRFHFTSGGAWSDQDGLWNTDGAFIVDSLTVSDATGTVLPTEFFESEALGANTTLSGNWKASAAQGFGTFAGLYSGLEVLQEDPCFTNLTCCWGFFNGSTATYACGGHPEQLAVPYGNSQEQYLNAELWSPFVPITGSGSTYEIAFDVYDDLPLDNLVFYRWHVRSLVGGCPAGWHNDAFVHRQAGIADWEPFRIEVSDKIDPAATAIQLSMAVIDQCPQWCGVFGTGACHTHAPLFDNAQIVRIDSNGPRWLVDDRFLFQDNFASDGTTTGTVRADAAVDVVSDFYTNIRPGDSVTVFVSEPENGLAADPNTGFGSAVYAYVGVWPQGQPGKSGSALTDDAFRWPVVGSLSHNGDTWYCVRMDTVFYTAGRLNPSQNRFCVDLADNLFTPGDTICYVFAAKSDGTGEMSYYSNLTGTTDDIDAALDNPMEFTCLPTSSFAGGPRILYVDEFDGLGAQPFFDTAFDILGIADRVDRYDVLRPTLGVNNGPASRVSSVTQQLVSTYSTIIWNTGGLDDNGLGDPGNVAGSEKQGDYQLLHDFLDGLASPGGVYLSGDHFASTWGTQTAAAMLKSDFINFTLLSADHAAYGLGVSPLVLGTPGGCFDHGGDLDSLIAYTACPVNGFLDVLQATGSSTAEAMYIDGVTTGAAILGQQTVNSQGATVGVMLSGFSFHDIRDYQSNGIPARAEHLADILAWLGSMAPTPTGPVSLANRYSLAQNYPNPFNPSTTVEFTVREKTRVTLRVYNVRGQLVKTLVDDTRAPGVTHRAEWDGRNDAGQAVASGVYFYRLASKEFAQTRKMVLLN